MEGEMEAAARVFAGEFNQTTLSMDAVEPGGFPALITPGGLRCTRLYLAGALTSVEGKPGEPMQARVADPTGAFTLTLDRREEEMAGILERLVPPVFVSVIGDARLVRRGPGLVPVIRLAEIREVGRQVRDAWVIRTGEVTISRLRTFAASLAGMSAPGDIRTAADHYHADRTLVLRLAAMSRTALSQVSAIPGGTIRPPDPRETVLAILGGYQKGVPVSELISVAGAQGLDEGVVNRVLEDLIREDECYQPSKGVIRLL
jgi:RPA family protein